MDRTVEVTELVGQTAILTPGTEIWNRDPGDDHGQEPQYGVIPERSTVETLIRGMDNLFTFGPVTKVSTENPDLLLPNETLDAGDVAPGRGQVIWWRNR